MLKEFAVKSNELTSALEANTLQATRSLRSVEGQISSINDRRLRLRHDITAALKELAVVQIQLNLFEGQGVHAQLKERADREAALRSVLSDLERKIAIGLARQDELAAALHEEIGRFENSLRENDRINDLVNSYEQEVKKHDEFVKNSQELLQECAKKLPEYSHPVYRYLRGQEFGDDSYQRKGLVRLLDSWLARISHYANNRGNESMLRAIQDRVNEDLVTRQNKVETLAKNIEAAKVEARSASKLPVMEQQLEDQQKMVAQSKREAKKLQAELSLYGSLSDPLYLAARDKIAAALMDTPIDVLVARARASATQEDDPITAKLNGLYEELKAQDAEQKQAQLSLEQATAQYERARTLEQNLRLQAWSGPRIEYAPGLDLNGLITGYMLGNMQMALLNAELGRYRREVESTPYSYGSVYSGSGGSSASGGSVGGWDWGASSSRSSDRSSSSGSSWGSVSSSDYASSDSFSSSDYSSSDSF